MKRKEGIERVIRTRLCRALPRARYLEIAAAARQDALRGIRGLGGATMIACSQAGESASACSACTRSALCSALLARSVPNRRQSPALTQRPGSYNSCSPTATSSNNNTEL